MKKVLGALLGFSLLFGSAGIALADPYPVTYHLGTTTTNEGDVANDVAATVPNGNFMYGLGFNPTTGLPEQWHFNQGFFLSGTQLDIVNLPITAVSGLDNYLTDYNSSKFPFLFSGLASATSSISSLSTSIGYLNATVGALNIYGSIGSFMGNNASTSPYIASSTKNGFLSTTDKVKLDSLSAPLAWSWATSSRSIVTGTGATGFQVSSTRVSTIHENVKITTTASIAGNADGYVTLEVAPTNSATASDWIEMGRCGNSQALTLAITLQSVQGTTCQLVGDVPAGYYSKLRSVTTTGTVSFAFVSGQEVLK